MDDTIVYCRNQNDQGHLGQSTGQKSNIKVSFVRMTSRLDSRARSQIELLKAEAFGQ